MFLSKRHAARLELGIASLLIVTGTLASSALSDDFTIDTPTNTTNGGFTLDGDDMLSITEDGSIETSAASGVEATGGHIVVVNDGRIETEGVGAIGITNFDSDHSTITNNGSISSKSGGIFNAISYGTTVTNNGTITTAGNESFGIVNSLSNNSTVLNAGSIFTSDDGADGINNTGSNNSMVTNSGVISTAGEGADGIFQIISAGTVIVNSGSITTRRFETHGIFYWSSDGAAVTNSGSILVEGENSYGIYNAYLSNNTTVSNSGSIRATAAASTGITVIEATNVSVTNSGFLVSEQGDALYIADSTNSTLNLSAPGYIGGSIHLGPDGTAVNFETGASHSVLWTLDGDITGGDPVISGDVPGFYNASTKQFATYDPSALA
ncbi:hypothetical protein, partial [Oricola sp.]|uniref:hypothetical protein n=1 Tax=Oricola sp. TaxID=1979950 RepID=UPI0025FBFD3E